MRVAFRFSDRRLLARLVAWWQRSDVSHCEVIVRSVGDVHECLSASWVDRGVRIKRMPLPADKWRVYEIVPGNSVTPAQWWVQHAGARYDWLALFGLVLRPTTKGREHRWYCEEVAADLAGFDEPWRYDVAGFEMYCRRQGVRLQ